MAIRIERRGFTKISAMMQQVVTDMLANGFTKLWPETYTPSTSKSIILQAGPTVDPLAADQPWAIKFQWDKAADGSPISETTSGGSLEVIVGTPNIFSSQGEAATYRRLQTWSTTGTNVEDGKDVIGLLGTATGRNYTPPTGTTQAIPQGFPDRTFLDRTRLQVGSGQDSTLAFPMSYQLVISPRGVALVVWEQGQDRDGNRYSWFVVQRPVDNVTGQVITTGKAPVHCVYGLMKSTINNPTSDAGNYNVRRFTVREADIVVPSPLATIGTVGDSVANPMMGVDATRNTMDYNAILNASQQVAITEQNKYVITLPNGLNTARYAYTHELDMIAYTSADVVSQGTEVPVSVYGEAQPRKYLAMNANGPNNTGMRLMLLAEGGGVPAQAPAGGGA